MEKINKTDFGRDLIGPYSYDRSNKISQICQLNYLRLIKLQNYLFIIIAFLISLPISDNDAEMWKEVITIILIIFIFFIFIYLNNRSYIQGWQNARFISESILSNAWLYSFKIGIYNSEENNAKKKFIDSVSIIEKEVDIKQFYSYYDTECPNIADWMNNIRNETDFIKKKAFYIKHRLNDQIKWYSKKSHSIRKQANLWFNLSLLLVAICIIIAFASILKCHLIFPFLGFFITITSTIQTWRQTKRFDELKITYSVAANELRALMVKFELEKDNSDIMKFVEEAEKAISREHKLWFNWTNIV